MVADVLDQDKNEEISREEFMDRFRPAYHIIEEEAHKQEEWTTAALHGMCVSLIIFYNLQQILSRTRSHVYRVEKEIS